VPAPVAGSVDEDAIRRMFVLDRIRSNGSSRRLVRSGISRWTVPPVSLRLPLLTTGRITHHKIVVVALVATITFVVVGISA
jgi:hypothetical protein